MYKKTRITQYLIIISLLTLISFITCSEDSDTSPNTETAIKELENEAPGAEAISRGYDITGKYADVEYTKDRILDIGKLHNDGKIEIQRIEKSEYNTIEGTSIEEYSSSMAISVGVSAQYGAFSGSVETNFSQSSSTSTKHSFCTIKSLIKKKKVQLKSTLSIDDLKAYLTTDAKNYINDKDKEPSEIFKSFGTHLIIGIFTGGRIDFNYSVDMSQVDTSKSIGVYAKASYGSVTGNTSVETTEEQSKFESNSEKTLFVYGGKSEYGQNIQNKGDYTKWTEGVEENTIFCDFTGNGLIPIWELADSNNRKSDIETAYKAYLASKAPGSTNLPMKAISEITVKGFNTTLTGFTKLEEDFNTGAGGDDIYLYFAEKMDPATAVVNIYTHNTSNGEPAPSGTNLGVDLNSGAGGDDIYLYVETGTDKNNYIRGLKITTDDNTVYSHVGCKTLAATDWVAVCNNSGTSGTNPQDMNEGAGGDDIYLYYTHKKCQ